jgi:hypothetical protein
MHSETVKSNLGRPNGLTVPSKWQTMRREIAVEARFTFTTSVLSYGVGSEMDALKMSLLPNVAGQSLFGAGFGIGLPVSKDWR